MTPRMDPNNHIHKMDPSTYNRIHIHIHKMDHDKDNIYHMDNIRNKGYNTQIQNIFCGRGCQTYQMLL